MFECVCVWEGGGLCYKRQPVFLRKLRWVERDHTEGHFNEVIICVNSK